MHMFIPKLSKSYFNFFTYIFEELFITFFRRQRYRKKRFRIPTCVFTALIIGGIVLGSVLGKRANIQPTGMIFRYSFQFNIQR
jgi:hypothetical protein